MKRTVDSLNYARLFCDPFSRELSPGRIKSIASKTFTGYHTETSHLQIIQELRRRGNAGYQQVISRTGAGDVKEVAFSVVDLFQIGVVASCRDPFLQWNYLVIADGPPWG